MNQSNNTPKLLYQKAETLRKANQIDDAQQHYIATINQTNERTKQRHQTLIDRVSNTRSRLKIKLTLLLFLPVAIASAALVTYHTLEKHFESLAVPLNPNNFLFIEWLAAKQTSDILSNLAKANPNLNFDVNQSMSANTPTELFQSLTSATMQERFRQQAQQDKDNNVSEDSTHNGESTYFQCTLEAPPSCDNEPTATGNRRDDIELVIDAYRAVLDNERHCDVIETAISAISKQVQWRRSELDIKTELDSVALRCFSRQENHEKAIEYSRKLQCSKDVGAINSSYWHLTSNHHKKGNIAQAETMYACFQESVAFMAKHDPQPWRIASSHRESGALAWLYFNDLETAVKELETARHVLKEAHYPSPILKQVTTEVDLDLLETYVTVNIDLTTFTNLHNDINNSGLLTDGYKQIKDALAGIYYLQNNDNANASIALDNIAQRFKHLPEYICDWDWSGFQRGLDGSIINPMARQKADQIVVATDCYVTQTSDERIAKVRDVVQWLTR